MKKFTTRAKWKRHATERTRAQVLANARFADYRRLKNIAATQGKQKHKFRRDSSLQAPKVFSLIQNPDEVIRFLNRMKALSSINNVFVDLSEVEIVTPEAIAALIAALHDGETLGARISGNVPKAPAAKTILNSSGFRDYVKSTDGFVYRTPMGRVRRRSRSLDTIQIKYNQAIALELIEFATEKLTGNAKSHGPSYSTFGEAMLNTINHASIDNEPQPWWASVYFDAQRKVACFTFIDQGVGIFKSHRLTASLRLLKHLSLLDNAELLKRIFDGEIRSWTRIPGRGNGLPGMYTHCKAGRIRNFVTIANDAIGNAETETYQAVRNAFAGTLLYWEIGE